MWNCSLWVWSQLKILSALKATEAAKKELGNGLVIMNVREVKKKGLFSFLSPKQIEVTAALEDESPQRSVVNSLNRTEASGAGVGTAKTVSMKNSTENIEKSWIVCRRFWKVS